MKVSIITICFNNEVGISDTINSVLNQNYSEIEYIIVDGASKDNTLNIIKSYGNKISKVISEPDRGIYDAINKGIKQSTGDIVGLIHAGDELFDDFVVEKIVQHFKNNDIDALYGHSKIVSEDGKKVVRINKSPSYNENLFRRGWLPSHQSFYVKRELFDKLGYYNIRYKIAADYDLLLRFIEIHKIKISLLDIFIVKFKLGGTSTKNISSIIEGNKECIKAWRENGLKISFYTFPMKFFRKGVQFISAKVSS